MESHIKSNLNCVDSQDSSDVYDLGIRNSGAKIKDARDFEIQMKFVMANLHLKIQLFFENKNGDVFDFLKRKKIKSENEVKRIYSTNSFFTHYLSCKKFIKLIRKIISENYTRNAENSSATVLSGRKDPQSILSLFPRECVEMIVLNKMALEKNELSRLLLEK